MRRWCEGYCGGYVDVGEIHQVGPDGERFCQQCYGTWLRRLYYE